MAEEKKDDEKKEASKQIRIRIAGVLQDPDLCDASFIVEMAEEKKDDEKKDTSCLLYTSPSPRD